MGMSGEDIYQYIEKIELIGKDPADGDIVIYLFEVRSVTAKLRNDTARRFHERPENAGADERLSGTRIHAAEPDGKRRPGERRKHFVLADWCGTKRKFRVCAFLYNNLLFILYKQ